MGNKLNPRTAFEAGHVAGYAGQEARNPYADRHTTNNRENRRQWQDGHAAGKADRKREERRSRNAKP